jgi:hypothetical protein
MSLFKEDPLKNHCWLVHIKVIASNLYIVFTAYQTHLASLSELTCIPHSLFI